MRVLVIQTLDNLVRRILVWLILHTSTYRDYLWEFVRELSIRAVIVAIATLNWISEVSCFFST